MANTLSFLSGWILKINAICGCFWGEEGRIDQKTLFFNCVSGVCMAGILVIASDSLRAHSFFIDQIFVQLLPKTIPLCLFFQVGPSPIHPRVSLDVVSLYHRLGGLRLLCRRPRRRGHRAAERCLGPACPGGGRPPRGPLQCHPVRRSQGPSPSSPREWSTSGGRVRAPPGERDHPDV